MGLSWVVAVNGKGRLLGAKTVGVAAEEEDEEEETRADGGCSYSCQWLGGKQC